MSLLANILVGVVAALHLLFLVLEMFLWTEPLGRKVFNNSVELAETTKVMAGNQGLYNGFLVAGLVWGLVSDQTDVKVFFLVCVVVAGVYGAATVSTRILLVQALPAALGLAAVLAAA
ncbi:DUF1304 domain-containing protein [Nocardioides lijunqiniae]|uniref:DUF1304 domain-containing protein n=1 Tax=Nocardioides lijunqiniae TaxID=2760832 RepID=UPI0018777A8E|nr:DUF1304 domain-containing protein [Nocardioides lijunqiniae]